MLFKFCPNVCFAISVHSIATLFDIPGYSGQYVAKRALLCLPFLFNQTAKFCFQMKMKRDSSALQKESDGASLNCAKMLKVDNHLIGFSVEKELNCLGDSKSIFLLGKKDEQSGVIILEKEPFDLKSATDVFNAEVGSCEEVFKNDIYSAHFLITRAESANRIKATVIYPATERHILKYSIKKSQMFEETADVYARCIKAFVEKQALSCQWVFNILEKKSEAERIFVEDGDPKNGFICVPDLKWNTVDMGTFHVIGIVQRRDLRSIRDVTAEELPLLKNMKDKCLCAIKEKYGLNPEDLRVFFHYQPTFYHLHLHFTSLGVHGAHVHVERAHLLTDVIQNLESDSDFYKKRTLSYAIFEGDPLMNFLQEQEVLN